GPQSGTQRQHSAASRIGCCPLGQAAQRTFEQSLAFMSLSLALTHLQQSGGWRAGICPAGHSAPRTAEQSTVAASASTELPDPVAPVAAAPVELVDVSVVAAVAE